ncbi:transposase [Virgibacillus sp. Bac332]|uniref:transposase n=1 Tax=Virgibacillus sp. Bac332 TaxID=2419842 RepID=UPI000EF49E25|nr:transposase [Virgibacillus sp. Bac332]QRZ16489.1 transposase [Virgibacillus sp. AGTR]QRZ16564.1 transposase [Virgibacillus sp. AGTR]QRZ16577.1 transposase [Virgibacillus sp. AGTR]QRZ17230.1 transposase [Virgibacillus sp. AGTR]QRZ18252.1 transposase [Virgibacillus sp. AGTR]
MSIIRQQSLFDIHELYEMEPTHHFEAVFSTINLDPILNLFDKPNKVGAPRELNYGAMIYSLIARVVERIVTIKDLIRRLKRDPIFRYDCGFLHSDQIPSEASYSRMVTIISESDEMEHIHDELIFLAIDEGHIGEENIAIDATHFEARDRAHTSDKKERTTPKKRGRKPKAEREQWLKEKQAEEEARPIYEKEIVHQLSESVEVLLNEAPIEPKWGVKKNSDGKNIFWFGYKGHLAVSTKSQYILAGMMTSGSLNDGKAAIPLLKKIDRDLPSLFTAGLFDAGYDYEPIYQQLIDQDLQAVIPYNRRNEGETVGYDEYFAPTCVLEHSYRYDSFDPKYKTLKYTRPKECATCPLQHDSLCQKTFKIKQSTDIRKYTNPARGSKKWDELYKERTAVERVNAYLKEFFGLNNVRHRTGKKSSLHFHLVTLVYNASRLAADRIRLEMKHKTLKAA